MLAVDQSTNPLPTRSTALYPIHHAKEGYDYPMVRLPHTLSLLAGLPTRIFQTVHKGALAFLAVIVPTDTPDDAAEECENNAASSETSVFTRRRSPVRIRPAPCVPLLF